MHRHTISLITLLLCLNLARAQSRQQIIDDTMHPYAGPVVKGVDSSTTKGKMLCGYQGWHAAEGDGLGRGWYHWAGRNGFQPGSCKFDLWPDVSELDPDEKYETPFKLADGSPAYVYSAFNKKTVLRHFKWMRDYGIDGVMVQRFITETLNDQGLRQFNTVLASCREGANTYGRVYAVMYDLSGLGADSIDRVIDDWKLLVDRMHITQDPAYLHEAGKPVVVIWGVGFNDHRKYTIPEVEKLISFLKKSEHYGNNWVTLGVPTHWRTLNQDAVSDPRLHEAIKMADGLSPWMVGRFATIEQVKHFAQQEMPQDLAWCRANHLAYWPVCYPGFSWHNMNPKSPPAAIPRLGGKFLWEQYYQYIKAGNTTLYQAMFDEVDEGTAIYKVTNDPPVGASKFVTYEGLPSDFYLKLAGEGTKMLRGERRVSEELPPKENRSK